MSVEAFTWALRQAPLPKSDPTARLVLASLAEQADKRGRSAHPQVLTIAHDLTVDPETVTRAIKRLQQYGLISKDGVSASGAVNWVLHLEMKRAPDSYEVFARTHRAKKAKRQADWRNPPVDDDGSSTGGAVDDDGSSTVDDAKSSTGGPVDDGKSSCRRRSIVSETTNNRLVDDSNGVHTRDIPVNTHPPTPPEGGGALFAVDRPKPKREGTEHPAFAGFWDLYRKHAKATGSSPGNRLPASQAFSKAIRHGTADEIAKAVPAYFSSKDPQRGFGQHASTWLNQRGWETPWEPYRGHSARPRLQTAQEHPDDPFAA